MEINELVKKAHENAVNHGFWNPTPAFGTSIALIHSELSEALEEEREGNPDFWFKEINGFKVSDMNEWRGEKPEGVAVELADAVIRIADLCGHLGIDLDAVIAEKMAYNAGRPYKHGKRF